MIKTTKYSSWVAHYASNNSKTTDGHHSEQEAPLSSRDRATRHVSRNYAKCRTDVHRIAFGKSCNRRMTLKVTQGYGKWHAISGV